MGTIKGQAMGKGHSHGPFGHGGAHKMSPGHTTGSNSPMNNPHTEASGHTVAPFGGGTLAGE